jgi:hypothetical protein
MPRDAAIGLDEVPKDGLHQPGRDNDAGLARGRAVCMISVPASAGAKRPTECDAERDSSFRVVG